MRANRYNAIIGPTLSLEVQTKTFNSALYHSLPLQCSGTLGCYVIVAKQLLLRADAARKADR